MTGMNRSYGTKHYFSPCTSQLLPPNGRTLFANRSLRLFAYGFLSVVLALYLAKMGLKERQIGLLFTLTLIGDTVISLWITTHADRIGRRRMLMAGAALMILAGVSLALPRNFLMLVPVATIVEHPAWAAVSYQRGSENHL